MVLHLHADDPLILPDFKQQRPRASAHANPNGRRGWVPTIGGKWLWTDDGALPVYATVAEATRVARSERDRLWPRPTRKKETLRDT